MTRSSPEIHAIIFCWPGKKANALYIAQSLVGHVGRVTVIDACPPDAPPQVPTAAAFEWRQVPTSFFYGGKFNAALELFDGDVMLQIQADASASSWVEVAAACRSAFEADLPIGVWAADVDFTLFPTRDVTLYRAPQSGFHVVSQTDCIVWALTSAVVDRLRTLSFAGNPLGWGVDLAAIAMAYTHGLLAVRDVRVRVDHPRSRGYNTADAARQAASYLAGLDPVERATHEMLMAHSHLHGMGLRGLIDQNRSVIRRQLEKRFGRVAAKPARGRRE